MDEKTFKIDAGFLKMSILLKDMFEDQEDADLQEIDLPTITGDVFLLIKYYCEHFNFQPKKENPIIEYPLKSNNISQILTDPWEAGFITALEFDQVLQLMLAANYLNIPQLFELTCAKIALEFRGKNFDQVKKEYGLENVNYTAEDDERL